MSRKVVTASCCTWIVWSTEQQVRCSVPLCPLCVCVFLCSALLETIYSSLSLMPHTFSVPVLIRGMNGKGVFVAMRFHKDGSMTHVVSGIQKSSGYNSRHEGQKTCKPRKKAGQDSTFPPNLPSLTSCFGLWRKEYHVAGFAGGLQKDHNQHT
ncbi:hypothetical protein B0O80DRAFT_427540 [Mortierella sp. GBAus27b]|nr:hypothetical protein B0O80DRAFT_427540 [Mortierella sp. GBAus27b]